MRIFLLTIFWITNIGSVIQLLIIVSAGWVLFSGASSFFELDVNLFVTQIVPWLFWVKTILVKFFGDLGYWILTIPILIVAPVKLVFGVIIGLWVYSTAKDLPV